MLGKIFSIIALVIFMTNNAFAQSNGLSKLVDFKHEVFRVLNMDTAGTASITSGDMSRFVRLAVDQMPTFVRGRELVKEGIVNESTQNVYIDSLVQSIKAVVKIDNDSFLVIQQRPIGWFGQDYEKGQSGQSDRDFRFFQYFADTLYLYPAAVGIEDDTLRVYYYQTPIFGSTADSIIVMDRPFQLGVVLYAAYLAEIRNGVGKSELAWKRYTDWLQNLQSNVIKRPIDLLSSEKRSG